MHYIKLNLLSCVLLCSLVLHSMDFHQKAVDRDQQGIDLRVVIALENQDALLPCAGQSKSVHELLNNGACDVHNPLNEALLYVLEHNRVEDKGCVAGYGCVGMQELFEAYGKGLYAIYVKEGKAFSILLLGTSNENHVNVLTAYLISKSSQAKEHSGSKRGNAGSSRVALQQILATYTARDNFPPQERAV